MEVFDLKKNIEKYADDDRIAVYFQDKVIDYSELNKLINSILFTFEELGIKQGSPIIIYMNNSLELVISYLAVLIYGGIIVPIDSEIPYIRVNEIIRECNAEILLHKTGDFNAQKVSCTTYCIEYDGLNRVSQNYKTQLMRVDSDILYIFTSGSTGAPKGVKITYRGIINHLTAKTSLLNLSGKEHFCLSFSPSFVASVWQILAPFYLGGSLTIYPKDVISDVYNFFKHLENDKISVVSLIPQQLYVYCMAVKKREKLPLCELKYIVLTGENIEARIVNTFYSLYTHIQLINAYGQSECSDDTFHYKIPVVAAQNNIPIGTPIKSVFFKIVDDTYADVNSHDRGELLIAGDCLASGYIDDDREEKFVFVNGVRFFKTGDIVRRIGDLVYFCGRKDNQIKIKGVRIEPEEIEAKVNIFSNIQQSLITPYQSKNQFEKTLHCYYVSDSAIDIELLKKHLKSHLPSYMIPTKFVKVDFIPTLLNGKIDRKKSTTVFAFEDCHISCIENDDNKTYKNIENAICRFLDIDLDSDINSFTFESSRIDSLSYIELVVYLEKRFEFEFDDEFLSYTCFSSIKELVEYVLRKSRYEC